MMSSFNRRNKELAKIHIGKKQLAMDNSTYENMLWTFGRVHSSADLDEHGRHAIIKHMTTCGAEFIKRSQKRKSTENASDNQIAMINSLWGNLVGAGIVRHPGDAAFRHWLQAATRHLHSKRIGWYSPRIMPAYVASNVIEQLKKWCDRTEVKY